MTIQKEIQMLHRRNKNLRVVSESGDPTDAIIDQIMTELNSEDNPVENMEEQIRQHKARFRRRIIIAVSAVVAAAVGIYLLIHLQTYTKARVSDTYAIKGAGNNSYEEFADGVLKYSRDGVSYLNHKGEEEWNQPYQIQNPSVDVCGDSAALADKGGNSIMIFHKGGLKGEIHTTLPIEKISVSGQGIVSAILKNESSPKVICYDTAGNVLVEIKASLSGSGYPVDVALSENGEVMLVSYLYTQEGKITSKAVYYNFGEAGEEKADHQVASKEYEGTIFPSAFFMKGETSTVVGDDRLVVYKGLDEPKEQVDVKIEKEIKSVFHSEKYIGMVLKNEGKEGYELRLYNTSGRQVMSKDFTGDYSQVKLSKSQVIMYDGKKCTIFLRTGVRKFDGEMKSNILEMFPIAGVNKYIVMNADGMEVVRLVK